MPTQSYNELIDIILSDYNTFKLRESAKKEQERLTNAEDEIFDILARQQNIAAFTLFFYEENNSEFKILQEIEDVFPSRFRTLFDIKSWVEEFDDFKNLKGIYKKGQLDNLKFDFGIVRYFFHSKFNTDFLDITAKIFLGKPLSKDYVFHRISDHLAEKFRHEEMYYDVHKALMLLKVLYKLQLIEDVPLKKEISMDNMYEVYFNKHPDFFNADVKKAIFLEGVLVKKVLNIQYQERNATPFRKRLNGLKLDARTVKRLLPEAIEKLEQYGKNYYKDLETNISSYLVSGEPDLKKMTVDEISFYFTMGMNLSNQFKKQEEGETGHE